MKRLALTFLMLFILSVPYAQEWQDMGGRQCAHHKQHMELHQGNPTRSENSPRHTFDVLNYSLDLDLYHNYAEPYPRSFVAQNKVTFRVDTALSEIRLNANQTSLQINAVGLSGSTFEHIPDTLLIVLDREYLPGEIVEVSIDYEHLDVPDQAFYVDGGNVFTDCEPEGARRWFPCWDQPSDKATLNLRAKVPVNVKLGSNGRLADSITIADTTWYTWISRDPIATYIMVLTSRLNYNLDIVYWKKPAPSTDTLPIRFYYNPGENPSRIKNMIVPLSDFYYSMFGDHPFEKDGFATVTRQFAWGGMENQSLTTLCQGCWNDELLVAHEYAHQWFGDMITCATWADVWLNEGFASYFEAEWMGQTNGLAAYKSRILYYANYYLNANPGWAISNPEWAASTPSSNVLFNYAITYAKGASVMHMFRYVAGDSLFYHTLYEYANDTAEFRYKSATIPDFMNKVNQVTNQDFDWFFNQWLFEPNHPVYRNTYNITQKEPNSWEVFFRAKQIQTNTVFFKMPLEIAITFTDDSDTLLMVMNELNEEDFYFSFDKEPKLLTFDPNNQIVLKNTNTVIDSEVSILKNFAITIHPNPASEYTLLSFFTTNAGVYTYNLLNLAGNIVTSGQKTINIAGEYTIEIPVADYPNGIYIVSLSNGKTEEHSKFSVMH